MIFLFAILFYPKAVKNQYFKYNFHSQFIEYRVGLSKKTNKFNIDTQTKIYCQIDEYLYDSGATYSASFYHIDSNGISNIFIQSDTEYKGYCLEFSKALIRYLTALSPIKKIEIIDKSY